MTPVFFAICPHHAAMWSYRAELPTEKIAQKMTFGDALILREAEKYGAEAVITWNTKDFVRRTSIAVLTPTHLVQHPQAGA